MACSTRLHHQSAYVRSWTEPSMFVCRVLSSGLAGWNSTRTANFSKNPSASNFYPPARKSPWTFAMEVPLPSLLLHALDKELGRPQTFDPGRPGQSFKEWSRGCGDWKMSEGVWNFWDILGLWLEAWSQAIHYILWTSSWSICRLWCYRAGEEYQAHQWNSRIQGQQQRSNIFLKRKWMRQKNRLSFAATVVICCELLWCSYAYDRPLMRVARKRCVKTAAAVSLIKSYPVPGRQHGLSTGSPGNWRNRNPACKSKRWVFGNPGRSNWYGTDLINWCIYIYNWY